MIKVFYSNCSRSFSEEEWSNLIKQVPVSLQNNINVLRRWKDRQASLIGKLLLIEALKREGYTGKLIEKLKYNAYNRPYLELPLDFNISHSEDIVVCAVCNTGLIGVDVEAIKFIDFSDFKNTMKEQEWMKIRESINPLKEFYKYWAIKESVIKAEGKGLSIVLNDMDVNDSEVILDNKKWHIYELFLNDNYSSWIASDKFGQQVKIEEIKF